MVARNSGVSHGGRDLDVQMRSANAEPSRLVRVVRIAPAGASSATQAIQPAVHQGGRVVPLKSRTEYEARAFAARTDPNMRIDPSPATSDKNVVRGMPPKNPHDNEIGMRKGGKVKAVLPITKARVAKGKRK